MKHVYVADKPFTTAAFLYSSQFYLLLSTAAPRKISTIKEQPATEHFAPFLDTLGLQRE